MPQDTPPRDYCLTGENSRTGYNLADWYITPINRKRLKSLMKRSDKPALINYGLWLGGIFLFGAMLVASWGSWSALPVAIIYGIFYGSGGDSRWHENSHGTVFRTRWLNDFFYQLASFMSFRNPYVWRWSHTRHHSETVIVGRDPEIAFPRPPSIWKWLLNLIYIPTSLDELKKMVRISFGNLTEAEKSFIPKIDRSKAFWASRIQLTLLLGVVALSLGLQEWLPVMLVGLPTFYGAWLHHLMATTQHAGLVEDIPDYRLNSRTVLMNPFFRFIYSNMNYHIEHHMFPNVPFYALPALHEEIKHDCPPPYPSLWAAYREIIPAVIRQQTDYSYFAKRPLPEGSGATPEIQRHPMALATK